MLTLLKILTAITPVLLGVILYRVPAIDTEQAEVNPTKISIIRKALCIILCLLELVTVAITGFLSENRNTAILTPILKPTSQIIIAIGCILFLGAIYVEWNNPPNAYSVKKRYLKYLLQDGGICLLCIGWAANIICRLLFKEASPATAAIIFCCVFLPFVSFGAGEAGSRFVYWVKRYKDTDDSDIKQNSKKLKKLRKSKMR